jgi:hypothetical protein
MMKWKVSSSRLGSVMTVFLRKAVGVIEELGFEQQMESS